MIVVNSATTENLEWMVVRVRLDLRDPLEKTLQMVSATKPLSLVSSNKF